MREMTTAASAASIPVSSTATDAASEEELYHDCSMCSYATTSLAALTRHVCRVHQHDPRFRVSCKSCLRSYRKWDSYRKHIQRGCQKIATQPAFDDEAMSSNTIDFDQAPPISLDAEQSEASASTTTSRQWREAAYILSVKEKHTLAQVAVDEILSTTSSFVSDILSGLVDSICSDISVNITSLLDEKIKKFSDTIFPFGFIDDTRKSISANIVNMLEEKAKHISDTLFEGISSEHLQKQYFRKQFGLVVSTFLLLLI